MGLIFVAVAALFSFLWHMHLYGHRIGRLFPFLSLRFTPALRLGFRVSEIVSKG